MRGYYTERLSAELLQRCYEIAPPRVRQYLDAEIEHVLSHVRASDAVLELGCGYGRVLGRLSEGAATAIGIDTSRSSLRVARDLLAKRGNCRVLCMDAASLGFCDHAFDVVACVQNGISAFRVDQRALIAESIRVARPGGRVMCSSYAAEFWEPRLEWFRLQADHGVIGEIDWEATGAGVIVCKDGFRATTVDADGFERLTCDFNVQRQIRVVDRSSLFCELAV